MKLHQLRSDIKLYVVTYADKLDVREIEAIGNNSFAILGDEITINGVKYTQVFPYNRSFVATNIHVETSSLSDVRDVLPIGTALEENSGLVLSINQYNCVVQNGITRWYYTMVDKNDRHYHVAIDSQINPDNIITMGEGITYYALGYMPKHVETDISKIHFSCHSKQEIMNNMKNVIDLQFFEWFSDFTQYGKVLNSEITDIDVISFNTHTMQYEIKSIFDTEFAKPYVIETIRYFCNQALEYESSFDYDTTTYINSESNGLMSDLALICNQHRKTKNISNHVLMIAFSEISGFSDNPIMRRYESKKYHIKRPVYFYIANIEESQDDIHLEMLNNHFLVFSMKRLINIL